MGTFYGNRTTRKGRRSPGADRALARRSMHGTFASSLGRLTRALQMESYPKFHNEVGVSIVRIGCREFKCIGVKRPQITPHIYFILAIPRSNAYPYCLTFFRSVRSLAA